MPNVYHWRLKLIIFTAVFNQVFCALLVWISIINDIKDLYNLVDCMLKFISIFLEYLKASLRGKGKHNWQVFNVSCRTLRGNFEQIYDEMLSRISSALLFRQYTKFALIKCGVIRGMLASQIFNRWHRRPLLTRSCYLELPFASAI